MGGDGLYDDNMLSATGKADVEGAVVTCPCAPATKAAGTFPADYKAKFGVDAGAYANVGYDVMNIFLQGIDAGKVTRADMLAFINAYNKGGEVSGVTYSWPASANGELDPAQVKVWAYEAKGGVVDAEGGDPETPDQGLTTSRTSTSTRCGRRRSIAVGRTEVHLADPGRSRRVHFNDLINSSRP